MLYWSGFSRTFWQGHSAKAGGNFSSANLRLKSEATDQESELVADAIVSRKALADVVTGSNSTSSTFP